CQSVLVLAQNLLELLAGLGLARPTRLPNDALAAFVEAERRGGDPPLPSFIPVQAAFPPASAAAHDAAWKPRPASRSSNATYSAIAAAGTKRVRPSVTDRKRPARSCSYITLRLSERISIASRIRYSSFSAMIPPPD